MKKILSTLIILAISLSLFSFVATATEDVTVVDGVTFSSDMKTIIEYPADKEGESYTIPESVTAIANSTFYENPYLKSITIPESVTAIGDFAFYDCIGLESIVIPESVTSMGEYVFSGCAGLKEATILSKLTVLPAFTFAYCESLTDIKLPDSLTTINYYAFFECSALKDITIPSTVTMIDSYAFGYCTSLESIVIPEGVASLGGNIFAFCESLKDVTIPESVISIGELAFEECIALENVHYGATEIEWNSIELGEFNEFLETANIIFSEADKNEIRVILNDKKVRFDQLPVIEDGRTLVPVRAIFEALGAEVAWDAENQTVRAIGHGIYVKLIINSNEMLVDNNVKVLEVPAKIINGRTMVPARAVAEAFGCDVSWDAELNAVIINL